MWSKSLNMADNFIEKIASGFGQNASVKNVFGEPIEVGDKKIMALVVVMVREVKIKFQSKQMNNLQRLNFLLVKERVEEVACMPGQKVFLKLVPKEQSLFLLMPIHNC